MIDKRTSRYKEGVHIQKCGYIAWLGKGLRAWVWRAEGGGQGTTVLKGSPAWAHCLETNTALLQTKEKILSFDHTFYLLWWRTAHLPRPK